MMDTGQPVSQSPGGRVSPRRLFDEDEMYTDDAMELDAVSRYKTAGYSLKDIESVLHDTVARLVGLELLRNRSM